MGNGPSSRRNGRIQHNPVAPPPPPRMIPPPSGYPGTVGPPPYPPTYAPNGHHMPYLYPPNYNGPMPAPMGPPQFYQQGYIPATNGQYAMSLPPQGFGPVPRPPPRPHIPPEAQKANTIRNDVNLKKQSLRLEKDEENPGFHLVAFTFDATVAGSISVFFLAKEGDQCSLTPLKPHLYKAIRVAFEKGLGQNFRQAPGTGVNLALFDERELSKEGPDEVYPLLVRAETVPKDPSANASLHEESPPGAPLPKYIHSQTTHAVIDKKDDGYKVKVVKQTIWVDGIRYDLQEIYGIENSGGGGSFDGSDAGKECVICMSEPRDTTVLPCRHMCMCSECAKVLRFQTNRCPICRTPVERLLEIKVPKNESLDIDSYIDRSSSFKGTSASQSSSSNTQSANKDSGTMEIKVRSSSFKGASASQSSSSISRSANTDVVALEMKENEFLSWPLRGSQAFLQDTDDLPAFQFRDHRVC